MAPTCELCETPEECLSGRFPCDLCGEFIAGPHVGRTGAEVLAAERNTDKKCKHRGGKSANTSARLT
jgi:hypothetical protein